MLEFLEERNRRRAIAMLFVHSIDEMSDILSTKTIKYNKIQQNNQEYIQFIDAVQFRKILFETGLY